MGYLADKLREQATAEPIPVQVGVDAGQLGDYSAIAVAEREQRDDGLHHVVRRLFRLPLGTPYPDVADRVVELIDGLERRSRQRLEAGEPGYRVTLALDVTGVGRGLHDVLQERGVRAVCPVTITGSDKLARRDDGEWSLGKSVMVSSLLLGIQTGRIHLPPASLETEALLRELQRFRGDKTRSGHATYGAESGSHDDFVTALGLATLPGIKPVVRVPFVYAFARAKRAW